MNWTKIQIKLHMQLISADPFQWKMFNYCFFDKNLQKNSENKTKCLLDKSTPINNNLLWHILLYSWATLTFGHFCCFAENSNFWVNIGKITFDKTFSMRNRETKNQNVFDQRAQFWIQRKSLRFIEFHLILNNFESGNTCDLYTAYERNTLFIYSLFTQQLFWFY